jgi:hypothetical protein
MPARRIAMHFACNSGNLHRWQFKSMQEFLRGELERMAARPSVSTRLEQVRKRKRASATQVSSGEIMHSRKADRRRVRSSMHRCWWRR